MGGLIEFMTHCLSGWVGGSNQLRMSRWVGGWVGGSINDVTYQDEIHLLPMLEHLGQHFLQEGALVHAFWPDLQVPSLQGVVFSPENLHRGPAEHAVQVVFEFFGLWWSGVGEWVGGWVRRREAAADCL